MKVGDYSIRWKHNVFKNKEVHGVKVKKELKKKSTDCIIYDGTGDIVAIGSCQCNKEDKFNKPVGRKLSFSRAVIHLTNRQLRTEFWDKFKEEDKTTFTINP